MILKAGVKAIFIALFIPFSGSVVLAQGIYNRHKQREREIHGQIIDKSNNPLPFATVIIQKTNNGTSSDHTGRFSLSGVKSSDIIEVSMIGYKTQAIKAENKKYFKIALEEDLSLLEEVVVTGVSVGTSARKLGFALSKVNKEKLEEVPATDLGNALRGKLAGVRIVQPNGDPNSVAGIRLRGSNSILGSQEPLIIVDGIIAGGSSNLKDINMEDVESIEVIKGAAASSLYGSLSGNGVIQIITKKGKNTEGKNIVNIRSEVGFSNIGRRYPLANTHAYLLRDANEYPWDLSDLDKQGRWVLNGESIRGDDPDGLLDNPFPRYVDNQKAVNTPQLNLNNFVSLTSGTKKFRYYMSFQNSRIGGAIEGVKPNIRNNGRINVDYTPNSKLRIKTSVYYAKTKGFRAPSSTRKNVLRLEPWIDITEKDAKGGYNPRPKGLKYGEEYYDNPLYEVGILENHYNRQRAMLSSDIKYNLTDDWQIGGSYSHDESRTESYNFKPMFYVDANPDTGREKKGTYSIGSDIFTTSIGSLFTNYKKKIEDLQTSFTLKFLREYRDKQAMFAGGSEFSVDGVKTLNITETQTRDIKSYEEVYKVSNYFFDANFDYKDKLIFNTMIRRDGSSSFGANNRWSTFGRASLAYILTEDLKIPHVNDLKLRVSWGTSGQRPQYSAQFETYEINRNGGLEPGLLGNKDLKPSRVAEWEFGLNTRFLDIFDLEVNYAKAKVKNDFIKAPLPKVTGFKEQWQNIGGLASEVFEFQLSADIIRTDNLHWNIGLSWDKVNQRITDLGGLSPFFRPGGRSLFRVEENKPYGLMYGNKIVKNIDELTTNADGIVINELPQEFKDKLTKSDFEVNEHGYVIVKGTKGTEKEQVICVSDENGNRIRTEIGNTTPDWNLGFTSNLSWKNFNFYFVLDHQQGGDIYNYTKQQLYSRRRHGDQEQFAKQGKHIKYSENSSKIYNGLQTISHFVEDGTFTKLREVALSYKMGEDILGKDSSLREIKLSLIGRNLLTFTNYSGFDPEVAYTGSLRYTGGLGTGKPRNRTLNTTNDRIDDSVYPQFKTYSLMLQVKF